MSEYDQLTPKDDGWTKWEIWPRKVRHACCFCNGVHDIEMKVDKRRNIWFRWRTNLKATAALRRKK